MLKIISFENLLLIFSLTSKSKLSIYNVNFVTPALKGAKLTKIRRKSPPFRVGKMTFSALFGLFFLNWYHSRYAKN